MLIPRPIRRLLHSTFLTIKIIIKNTAVHPDDTIAMIAMETCLCVTMGLCVTVGLCITADLCIPKTDIDQAF